MLCGRSLVFILHKCFPGDSGGKNLPAMGEMCVQSLDQEDPLEKEMANHSSVLAWESPWTEEPGPWGHIRIRHNLVTKQQGIGRQNQWL